MSGVKDQRPTVERHLSRVVYGNRTRVTGLRNRFPAAERTPHVVRAAGIEPAISGMSNRRSAAELRAHYVTPETSKARRGSILRRALPVRASSLTGERPP